MTRDEAIEEARACVRDGCQYASADLVRGLLEAYDEARAEAAQLTAICDRIDACTLELAASAATWERQCAEARADVVRLARERDEAVEALEALEAEIDEHLPEYVLDDGTDEPANARERVEYAGAEIDRLRRERDEARAELDHMRQGYDRVRADRDYHCDRAIAAVAERDEAVARAERAEEAADLLRGECRDGEHGPWCREWRAMVARAERAEAQLAALREESRSLLFAIVGDATFGPSLALGVACRALDAALADTEAAAEAHDRRVRAEALREAADVYVDEDDGEPRGTRDTAKWLRARADEIERGER